MNSPIEIISGIWVGDINYSLNKQFYINNNIDIVINCTHDQDFIEDMARDLIDEIAPDFPSKYNLHVINDYVEKLLEIMYKSIDNFNIFIYSYQTDIIPLSIVSLFIAKYGGIKEDSIEAIIKSKINIDAFPREICIDLSLFKHLIE